MGVSPTSAEVESAILDLAERHRTLVAVREVCATPQGRPFHAVTVTDPDTPAEDKQHVLVIASQHGNEESTRLIALALLRWLTSDEAHAIRARQRIVVIPNANPDGTDADTASTSQGVNLNQDHPPTGATSPEGRALERVAEELLPDAVVDLHARGFAGCSYDMVLYPWTRPYTEDGRILAALAEKMAAAGEAAGIPHVVHPLTWPGWWENIPADESSRTLAFVYRSFKSLCLLTETSESNEVAAPPALRVAAGTARLRTLLEFGQERHPSLRHRGYPVELVTNLFHLGIVAVGADAAARRRSRVEIWRQASHFKRLSIDIPEHPERKVIRCVYTGPALPHGAGFQVRCPGRWAEVSAQLDGHKLDEADRLATWRDRCSTFVQVSVPDFAAGEYELRLSLR